MSKIILASALALAIISSLSAGQAFAAAPAGIATLAARPQCTVAGSQVIVRGAVTVGNVNQPVSDATVKLEYGSAIGYATTNPSGVYVATFNRGTATRVRELATLVPAATGSHVPVNAAEGQGGCTVPLASVGALRVMR